MVWPCPENDGGKTTEERNEMDTDGKKKERKIKEIMIWGHIMISANIRKCN